MKTKLVKIVREDSKDLAMCNAMFVRTDGDKIYEIAGTVKDNSWRQHRLFNGSASVLFDNIEDIESWRRSLDKPRKCDVCGYVRADVKRYEWLGGEFDFFCSICKDEVTPIIGNDYRK